MGIIKNIALDILNVIAILVNGLWSVWLYHTNRYTSQTFNYGPEKHQKLDLYIPSESRADNNPIIIYAHGGGWITGSHKNIPPAIWTQLERGYRVASVSYGLLPGSKFPKPIKDILLAYQYLKDHADELHIDTDQMIGWGLSAGAQIITYAALKHQICSAVISWYGFSDLDVDDPRYFHPITKRLISAYVGDHSVNTTNLITKGSPSFYIVHGTRDSYVPADQSVRLYESLQGSDNTSRIKIYKGYYHGDWRLNYEHSLREINLFLDQVTRHRANS
jgi:acetyl esterase/lipase